MDKAPPCDALLYISIMLIESKILDSGQELQISNNGEQGLYPFSYMGQRDKSGVSSGLTLVYEMEV